MTIVIPQAPEDERQVVRSIDADGRLVFSQVGFDEINFGAVFGGKTTSSTENAVGHGTRTFTLDADDGRIAVGYTVQIVSLDDPDCFMYGFVTRKDTAVSPVEIDVAISVVSAAANTSSNWEIQIIAGPALGLENDTLAISESNVPIAPGRVSFTVPAGKFFPETASVLVRDLAHSGNYMYGNIAAYSGETLDLELRNVFGEGSSSAWAIRLLDGPGALETGLAEDWGSIADAAEGSPGGPDNYRFIAEAHALADDYGLITAVSTTSENYGTL